jgi:hypothetical protein
LSGSQFQATGFAGGKVTFYWAGHTAVKDPVRLFPEVIFCPKRTHLADGNYGSAMNPQSVHGW